MTVRVQFFSWCKDLTGCAGISESLPEGSTLGDLCVRLGSRFPKLEAVQKSILLAVGVDYQTRERILKEGDEVSLFPPVQGG